MLNYITRRVIGTIPVIILISLLVFMLVQAAPGDPADLLREVLVKFESVRSSGAAPPDLRERLLQTMACKAAVKAGQPLSPEAQEDLIQGREQAFQPWNCPHGRPSELFISWQELERRFDRK